MLLCWFLLSCFFNYYTADSVAVKTQKAQKLRQDTSHPRLARACQGGSGAYASALLRT